MEKGKKESNLGVVLGAAFLMATAAIGPGFLTQTAKFTSDYQGSFGFVILASIVIGIIVQLNIWRVVCGSGLRGQDVANQVVSGLGYFICVLICLGGLVFNIGNVGGGGLGFNVLFNIPVSAGCVITGILGVVIFLSKNAGKAIDRLTTVLGGLMIVVILIVIFIVKPPMGTAIRETVLPATGYVALFPAVLTMIGGTVGGYISFSGAHRLIDAGVTREENMDQIVKSSATGILVASLVRILLFLAVLGVVAKGLSLDASNPAADAFRQGAGEMGYKFFGIVLLCASITSVVGCAFTSVSFMKTLSKTVNRNEKWFIIGFIALSTVIMTMLGQPANLLVLAGALNGLILPFTLGACLIASQKKSIMGEHYRHPKILLILGVIVVIMAAYLGISSLSNLSKLF